MRRVLAIVRKEFHQIRRTRAYFALIFVAPFAMLLILGSAITTEVRNVPIAAVDLDHSVRSREIVRSFEGSHSFSFLGTIGSVREATRLLDDGTAKIAVVIPRDFERRLVDGGEPAVQLLIDGVDGNSAGVGLGYATAVLAGIQQQWAGELSAPGARHAPFAILSPPGTGSIRQIALVPRMWYNPNLDSKLNFVPGLIGILLIMVTTFLTAVNIVREKEIGTFEQLMVTPLGGLELVVGKIIPYTILGFAQLSISLVAAGLVFGLWMKGSLLVFYAMAAVFALSTLGVGIFVSTLARTQQQAMFIAWFIMIYTLLLSGFFVPIDNMPPFIQYITYLNPLRYFISALREIFLKGTPLRFMWQEAAAMGGIGMFTLTVAALRFRKRLA